MSRAFVAFYMGDYQKKTQHLDTLQHGAYILLLQHCWTHGSIPLEPAARAAVARMTPQAWKKIAPTINAFFDAEGRNKRATQEIEKAEQVSLKRAMAGQKGGFKSGISKSIANGQQLRSKEQANATDLLKQTPKQKPTNSVPIQNSKLETSFVAARVPVENAEHSGGSLATALPAGALREPLFPETNRLLAGLERLKAAKLAEPDPGKTDGKVWVDIDTEEWSAHVAYAQSRKIRPRLASKRIDERGVERTGAYFDQQWPDGFNEFGDGVAPTSEEDAA